jgi:hypothetical protein
MIEDRFMTTLGLVVATAGGESLQAHDRCVAELARIHAATLTDADHLRAEVAAAERERDDLRVKLAEAEKDTRLLDWLDANATYAIRSRIPGSMGVGVVRWRPGHDEAIDARKVLRDAMEHHAALAESEEK